MDIVFMMRQQFARRYFKNIVFFSCLQYVITCMHKVFACFVAQWPVQQFFTHMRTYIGQIYIVVKTSRKKLPSYGKVDITIYECTCNILICGGILLKFQQNTRFEMCNPINVEFIFCCVAF